MNETILEEAIRIVNGDRAQAYGDSNEMLERIAELWAPILRDCVEVDLDGSFEVRIKPRHTALCLIQLKVAREINSPKRDNAVDIAGYGEILGRAQEAEAVSVAEADRIHRDREKVGYAYRFMQDFESRAALYGDGKERNRLLSNFWSEYGIGTGETSKIEAEIAEVFVEKLKEANGLLARGCENVLLHYDPKFAPESNGIYLTWDEPKTDLKNEKTDLENPKCQAAEPKSEATFVFKVGDLVNVNEIQGVWVIDRICNPKGQRPTATLYRFYGEQIGAGGPSCVAFLGELTPAKTDSPNAEPPAAESKSEATAEVDALRAKAAAVELRYRERAGEEVSEEQVAETKLALASAALGTAYGTAVRFIGKLPALGAEYGYKPGQGGIAGLNPDSPFRAGGIVDQGEPIAVHLGAPRSGMCFTEQAFVGEGPAHVVFQPRIIGDADDVESLWRELGAGTWVNVADDVKPFAGYGTGVVKDIVSCTATTGEGLRKIVKAVVEFPTTSLPGHPIGKERFTLNVDDLRLTFFRRDARNA